MLTRQNAPSQPSDSLFRHLFYLAIVFAETYTTESFGVRVGVQLPINPKERRAADILESATRCVCNLLWHSETINLPDYREVARKLFYGIKRRLASQKDYAERYAAAMNQYIQLGHARFFTTPELSGPVGRTWYLPHHGVKNKL